MQPEEAVKKCPMCGEEILAVAIKCKHCQSTIGAAAPTPDDAPGQGVPRRPRVLAWVGIIVAAALASAFVNGIFEARAASQVAREIGYGMTGSDVLGLYRDLGGEPSCNGGGIATFALTIVAGALLLRRSRKVPAHLSPSTALAWAGVVAAALVAAILVEGLPRVAEERKARAEVEQKARASGLAMGEADIDFAVRKAVKRPSFGAGGVTAFVATFAIGSFALRRLRGQRR